MLLNFFALSGRSVVALWTFTLKEAGSNLLEIFKFFHWYFYNFVYSTSRLKTPGSNPLKTVEGVGGYTTVRQFALASVFIIILCLEDSNQETSKWSKKIKWNFLYVSSRFEPVTFRVSVKINLHVSIVVDYGKTCDFLFLRSNIFVRMKKFAKPFSPFQIGPRSNLLSKNNWSKILWHCPFKYFDHPP